MKVSYRRLLCSRNTELQKLQLDRVHYVSLEYLKHCFNGMETGGHASMHLENLGCMVFLQHHQLLQADVSQFM